jgi:hypothetical protein
LEVLIVQKIHSTFFAPPTLYFTEYVTSVEILSGIFGKFQIPVDSLNETSGGGMMVIPK